MIKLLLILFPFTAFAQSKGVRLHATGLYVIDYNSQGQPTDSVQLGYPTLQAIVNGLGYTPVNPIAISNINNTSDLNKPISTATQAALNLKANTSAIPTTTSQLTNNSGFLTSVTKSDVGLGSVDNTSDATKNAASAVLSSKTINAFNFGADAGANDSYVITLSPAPAAYTTGMIVVFKANTVNTGAASININGLGVKTIVKRVSTVLANGDIPALSFCILVYDGTNFTLINPIVN